MELDLGLGGPGPAAPLEIAFLADEPPVDRPVRAYDPSGSAGHRSDEVFRQLVLARIIEPTSWSSGLDHGRYA